MPEGSPNNEATARLKINKRLEEAGWRFFPDGNQPANVVLEANTALTREAIDALGNNFEHTTHGKIDFLLLDANGHPLLVLEAKSESKDPHDGKEQARAYARSQNCRFVILSNGNLHYFWDLERGNPYQITKFPEPDSVKGYAKRKPNPQRIIDEAINQDYIVLTQRPGYTNEAAYQNEAERPGYLLTHGLRFLRGYQVRALHALQRAVKDGNDRFLFEMATGTGKTLVSAAVIKLFLRTNNAARVLFLVDRLELEDQAVKNFRKYLSNDFTTVIYKERQHNWRQADIVVSTVQSLQFNNKYRQLFSPTDFDLVISDEAHRSIRGNARGVFDFFVGYKLGLTATPRDYLKKFDRDNATDPREVERRLLLDTYATFGCQSADPTFRYSLVDAVNDPDGPFLVNPTTVDCRTDITTQLLAEQGIVITTTDEDGNENEETYKHKDFEKKYFSGATNEVFCKALLQHGLKDPITNEFGKTLVFAVSQNHAQKITATLNHLADQMYPGKYQSNFAVQVTSRIPDAQQYTKDFANNKLLGSANGHPDYATSKARVCVTVGMMTTGYDCPDLLNLALMRPVFSPTDFVQMKGRGTRLHDFAQEARDPALVPEDADTAKTTFKLFDFFGNCEYFETGYNYDAVLELPRPTSGSGGDEDEPGGGGGEQPPPPPPPDGAYEHLGADRLAELTEQQIGPQGMLIDRMLFQKFEEAARSDQTLAAAVEAGQWDRVIDHVNAELFDKPDDYFTIDKLRKSAGVDRRLSLREILEKVFDLIPRFKSKDELLEEEFDKFITTRKPPAPEALPAVKYYFKSYATSKTLQQIIDQRQINDLFTHPGFGIKDFQAVPETFRTAVPEYIKDYVNLNQFA